MKTWDSLDPKKLRPLDDETLRQPIVEPPAVKMPAIPQEAPNGRRQAD